MMYRDLSSEKAFAASQFPDFDTLRVKTPDNKGFSFFSRHYINNVWSKQRFCFENRINLPGILSNF